MDYTYQVFTKFTSVASDDDEDEAKVIKQVVYGVVITYIE